MLLGVYDEESYFPEDATYTASAEDDTYTTSDTTYVSRGMTTVLAVNKEDNMFEEGMKVLVDGVYSGTIVALVQDEDGHGVTISPDDGTADFTIYDKSRLEVA